MLGDEGADLASASSAALERERYAVHAIPIVDTKGWMDVNIMGFIERTGGAYQLELYWH
jgi:hypothetical protein